MKESGRYGDSNSRMVFLGCIIGAVLHFIACYPGYMTGDSLDQYGQSLTGAYNQWHPPVMAAWWRCLNLISSGPQCMLAFQVVCLWAGMFFLADIVRSSRWWWLAVGLFAFAPFVQNHAGYIVKDAQMALSWFLACMWMLHIAVYKRKPHAVEVVLCTVLLVYGCWIRLNALPGFVPLCFLWAHVFLPGKRRLLQWAAAGVLIGASVLSLKGFNNYVVHSAKAYPELKLFMHDLSGIYIRTGQDVFPASLYDNPQFDTGYIRRRYNPTTFDNIWWNNDGVKILDGDDASLYPVLKQAWLQAVAAHPATYAQMRADGLLYYLRIRNSGDHFYYTIDFIDDNRWGFKVSDNFLRRLWLKGIHLNGAMPWMRPWFWILLNVGLLFGTAKLRNSGYRVVAKAMLWSGLLYFLPLYFLYQADHEFRFTYWNCFVCSLTLLFYIAERLEKPVPSPS
ncbi:MAG: hypothetical protein JNL72_09620 [Flavipsychrobacter sp.]|nr:hypothetical protein [Flavipsychrobacter sp.]